jgi:hypothetical protein
LPECMRGPTTFISRGDYVSGIVRHQYFHATIINSAAKASLAFGLAIVASIIEGRFVAKSTIKQKPPWPSGKASHL